VSPLRGSLWNGLSPKADALGYRYFAAPRLGKAISSQALSLRFDVAALDEVIEIEKPATRHEPSPSPPHAEREASDLDS